MLTTAQQTTLVNALLASQDSVLAPLVVARDNVLIAEFLNSPSATDAWGERVDTTTLVDAMDFTKFDTLTAGKRDAWALFLQYAPFDFGRNKFRKAIVDIWGTTDSVPILQSCTRKATNGELIFGGTSKNTNTVAALDLVFDGNISDYDVSIAFLTLE